MRKPTQKIIRGPKPTLLNRIFLDMEKNPRSQSFKRDQTKNKNIFDSCSDDSSGNSQSKQSEFGGNDDYLEVEIEESEFAGLFQEKDIHLGHSIKNSLML